MSRVEVAGIKIEEWQFPKRCVTEVFLTSKKPAEDLNRFKEAVICLPVAGLEIEDRLWDGRSLPGSDVRRFRFAITEGQRSALVAQ